MVIYSSGGQRYQGQQFGQQGEEGFLSSTENQLKFISFGTHALMFLLLLENKYHIDCIGLFHYKEFLYIFKED